MPVTDLISNKFFYPLFILTATSWCLFRSNGFFAFAFMAAVVLFVIAIVKKYRKFIYKALILFVIPLIISGVVKGPIYTAAKIEPVDFVEGVCIPLQQISRVAAADLRPDLYGNAHITDAERELIGKVVPYDLIPEIYTPDFADSMKELVRVSGDQDYLEKHKMEFLLLWAKLLPRNLLIYVEAYTDNTVGFWFSDYAYDTASIDGVFRNLTGVYRAPIIDGPFMKIKEILLKMGDFIPIYGLLFASGTYSIILLAKIFITSEKVHNNKDKNYSKLLPLLPALMVLLTILISVPLAAEFRYTYFIVLSLPLWLQA